jgi:hypothetical protein
MVSFPQVSPTKPCTIPILSPIRATWPSHLVVLELITRKIWCEEYRTLSFSLCIFPHSCFRNNLKFLSTAQLQAEKTDSLPLPIHKKQHPILLFVHCTAVNTSHLPLHS